MMDAIARFVILFVFISLGFSSAFHLLYDNSTVYSNFGPSFLTTSITIFSGYDVPEYTSLLSLPNAIMGYVFQIALVIIGVVLLINFLIAMMATIYEKYQENSTDEYRWIIICEINKLRGPNAWPVPFNLVQPPLVFCSYLFNKISADEEIYADRILCDEEVKLDLFSTMVMGLFHDSLGSEYLHERNIGQEEDPEEIAGMKKEQIDELAKYLSFVSKTQSPHIPGERNSIITSSSEFLIAHSPESILNNI